MTTISPGSSPGNPIFPATNCKKTLRKMLSRRDKLLAKWDTFSYSTKYSGLYDATVPLDKERKAIRQKLKAKNEHPRIH